MVIDWIALSVAIAAASIAIFAYFESRRYRKTVTEAQLAVKCQPGSDNDLEVMVVNVGSGIAYDVTFTESSVEDARRDQPPWSLDLGDLLPNEQRVVFRVAASELRTKSPMMVGLRYRRDVQHAYPFVRPKRSTFPEYQRVIDFGQFAYELHERKNKPPRGRAKDEDRY